VACWDEYKRILEKGRVSARDTLKMVVGVDFVYENLLVHGRPFFRKCINLLS
jgi:hypothetical protein